MNPFLLVTAGKLLLVNWLCFIAGMLAMACWFHFVRGRLFGLYLLIMAVPGVLLDLAVNAAVGFIDFFECKPSKKDI